MGGISVEFDCWGEVLCEGTRAVAAENGSHVLKVRYHVDQELVINEPWHGAEVEETGPATLRGAVLTPLLPVLVKIREDINAGFSRSSW